MTAAVGIAQSGVNNVSWRNRIINGGMVVDQRNAGASVTPTTANTTYAVDRFVFLVSQATKLTAQRSTVAPAGFTNSLLVTSSSAYSVGTNDFFGFKQPIEGFNVADLGWGAAGAQSVTLSFWVRSSLTGTFSGTLYNSAANRVYPFTYSISAANTFEYKTVTIAGDTTGTWLTDNGIGIQVYFNLGAGSGQTAAAGAWTTSGFAGANSTTSLVGTNGATFYITGVQLERGTTATPFEYRDYGWELIMCQRYFIRSQQYGANTSGSSSMTNYIGLSVGAANWLWCCVDFPTTMRTTPAITTSDFLGNTGRLSIWTSSGGGFSSNIVPYSIFPTTDNFSFSDYNNAKFGVGIGGYIASAEL